MLASLATLASLVLLPPVAPAPVVADAEAWTAVVAYDEVRVDVDTSRIAGAGPYTVWLRWSFGERAASPQAWDEGVRFSIDVVEVDCRSGATRTHASTAYASDGAVVEAMSFAEDAPAWRRPRAESVGGQVAREVCGLVRRPG